MILNAFLLKRYSTAPEQLGVTVLSVGTEKKNASLIEKKKKKKGKTKEGKGKVQRKICE